MFKNAVMNATLALLLGCPSALASTEIELVSRGPSGEKANDNSSSPAVSRDGGYVAFTSTATNLDAGDADAVSDVYRKDLDTGALTLVSRATGPAGAKATDDSVRPSISADGRFIAFTSEADNLAPGTPTEGGQVFVRDVEGATTTLVSRASGGDGAIGAGVSSRSAISADGRFVAFDSTSSLAGTGEFGTNVYVRDPATQTTRLASKASGPEGAAGNDVSTHPSISANGAKVAFTSYASNFDHHHPVSLSALYVHDFATDTTSLESRSSGRVGKAGNSSIGAAEISANGRKLAFQSDSTNLVSGSTGPFKDLFTRDLQSRKTGIVSRKLPGPRKLDRGLSGPLTISASGRRLAFSYIFEEKPGVGRREFVFLADLRRGEVSRVPKVGGREIESASSMSPLSISGNGRWLAVRSVKSLDRDDRDELADIYLIRLQPR